MQEGNKFWFTNAEKMNCLSQISLTDENICKKVLAACDQYLNSYIKFLVPPQESCCVQLARFLEDHNCEFRFPSAAAAAGLRLVGRDVETEPSKDSDEETAKAPLVKPLSPKMCRFQEIDERRPIATEVSDELEDVIYLPEKALSCESFVSDKSKVTIVDIAQIHQKTTPSTPLSAQAFRPRYTTQVSMISQKSNTVNLYSCWPPPIGIFLISVLEVLLFILNEKKSPDGGRPSHGVISDALMFDPYRRKEAWRFITYLFVHIGYQHLLFNLAVQIFLGVILEMVHQRWRILTIYFAGILAGSLGTSVFNPGVKLAGASGGVYALITAHIATVILKWKDMQYPATQLLAFMIVIITDLSHGVSSVYHSRYEDISYVAHGCGALAGFLVGFPILRRLSSDMKIRWFQYVGLILYGLLIMTAIFWNIFAVDYYPRQQV